MTSLRAPSDNSLLPKPVVPAKRDRTEFEGTVTNEAKILAGGKPIPLLLQMFCGAEHGCKRAPESYLYKKVLVNHIKNRHVENLPSAHNPVLCCNTPYTVIDQYIDHHWDTHKVQKGVPPSVMPSAAPTPEHGPPPLKNRTHHDTRSNSVCGTTLCPNAGTNVYSNAVTPSSASLVSMNAISSTRNLPGYAVEWSLPFQDVDPEDCMYYHASLDGQPWEPDLFKQTMQNGYSANHPQQKEIMPENYHTFAYQQSMYNDTRAQQMQ
jgi:hypothetical protein